MKTGWCPICRAFVTDGTACGECRRRLAWGTILRFVDQKMGTVIVHGHGVAPDAETLQVLGAVAMLMQERQALIHRHRKDMMDEQRAANAAARDSYHDGHDQGRREGRGDW